MRTLLKLISKILCLKHFWLCGDGQNASFTVHMYFNVIFIQLNVCCLYFSDKIVDVDAVVLGSYVPFTYLFGVTIHYKTGEVGSYSPILYSWHFTRFLSPIVDVVVNTTSPLLNYTFDSADNYDYRVWVFNAISTGYAEGRFIGCYMLYIMLLLFSCY